MTISDLLAKEQAQRRLAYHHAQIARHKAGMVVATLKVIHE